MKILYRLLVVILCFISPIYFICLVFLLVAINLFRYIIVGKTYCIHVICEKHFNKLFKLVDYCNNRED